MKQLLLCHIPLVSSAPCRRRWCGLAIAAVLTTMVAVPVHAGLPAYRTFILPGAYLTFVDGGADIDGDSRADIVIGSYDESKAWTFSPWSGAQIHFWYLPGEYYFGFHVVSMGDIDSDSYGDVLVTAYSTTLSPASPQSFQGKQWIDGRFHLGQRGVDDDWIIQ